MKTKNYVFTVVSGLLIGTIWFVLGSANTFEAKSVLGSLWQYQQNWNDEVIYITGVKVWIGTANPQTTLDINGALKLGDTKATCNTKLKGVIRYHNNLFQVCNGTSWN